MKKASKVSGSTAEQLAIPGMEVKSSSVDSEGLRLTLGKNTYDMTWDMKERG